MRGKMVNYLVNLKDINIELVIEFSSDGFKYKDELSQMIKK